VYGSKEAKLGWCMLNWEVMCAVVYIKEPANIRSSVRVDFRAVAYQ
jgi:hypothetical protein